MPELSRVGRLIPLNATCQRCALAGDFVSTECRGNSALMAVLACGCSACADCAPVCGR